ncbi:hypothetical protein [Collinsella sp. Sow4_E3]|uniref:hypothetical protein n=1 Tax=Collinsella sp. Sow4_E3 TaxID=3438776 RepID=UPI003F8E0E2C
MASTSTPTTRPALLGIAHGGPVRVTELGKGHGGIVWTVQPGNFPALLAMVNANGGPDCWRIEAL